MYDVVTEYSNFELISTYAVLQVSMHNNVKFIMSKTNNNPVQRYNKITINLSIAKRIII